MKINYYLMLAVMVTAGAVAQNTNNPLPTDIPLPPVPSPISPAPGLAPAPSAETNTPAKKTASKHHKKSAKKAGAKSTAKSTGAGQAKFSEFPATLAPGPAEVAVSALNVRGQAGLKGEVVAHLQKGDAVTVLSQINLDTHKAGEPSQWAMIALPHGSDVWVRSSFINESDKTVKVKKLNLRAGPSEDYSVVGVIERGTMVNELSTKGDWTKIEAPTNAFGFVAVMYLKQEASGNMAVNPSPSTETGLTTETKPMPATATTVTEPTPIVNQAAPPQQAMPANPGNNNNTLLPPPVTSENSGQPQPTAGQPTEPDNSVPPPPRVVSHEGYVRGSISPVAPTYFELYDDTSERAIDYLHSSTTNLNLARYNGFEIIVTGEEGLDARWKDTPVLTVQQIYVVSTNKPAVHVLKSPRASSMH